MHKGKYRKRRDKLFFQFLVRSLNQLFLSMALKLPDLVEFIYAANSNYKRKRNNKGTI
jgi:hypothetical protein